MRILTNKKAKKLIIALAVVILTVGIIAGACTIYVSDYYRADLIAVAAHAEECEGYACISFPDEKTAVFAPDGATKGLIFYPGGKVEFTSYLPLMAACAEQGILCVLVEMPANLAVLDINAADRIIGEYPEIESWYVGGHSLGGSMAASYLSKHPNELDGLILLGSYSTADLTTLGAEVLSVYGSEDGVMNREKYEKYAINLPQGYEEFIIEGGCHAYFGMYGEQDGDGQATVTPTEQISITAEKIAKFILE